MILRLSFLCPHCPTDISVSDSNPALIDLSRPPLRDLHSAFSSLVNAHLATHKGEKVEESKDDQETGEYDDPTPDLIFTFRVPTTDA